MTTLDRAHWHAELATFPEDLDPRFGGTHIGMFLAWAVLRGLASHALEQRAPTALHELRMRRRTGRELLEELGGGLTDSDLAPEGVSFAYRYYAGRTWSDSYLHDYLETFAVASPYMVADSWENFDLITEVVDRRFQEWKQEIQRGVNYFNSLGQRRWDKPYNFVDVASDTQMTHDYDGIPMSVAVASAWEWTDFLQQHGLLRRAMAAGPDDIGRDFTISTEDLTDEGLAMMRAGYTEYLVANEKSGYRDWRPLLQALADVRSGQ